MPTPPARSDATPTVTATAEPEEPLVEDDRELVEADLLVEDVSIDGMCGVY
jgi:mycofactocin precursor peptide MftA